MIDPIRARALAASKINAAWLKVNAIGPTDAAYKRALLKALRKEVDATFGFWDVATVFRTARRAYVTAQGVIGGDY